MKSLLTEDVILKVLAKSFYQVILQKMKINFYANRNVAAEAFKLNRFASYNNEKMAQIYTCSFVITIFVFSKTTIS